MGSDAEAFSMTELLATPLTSPFVVMVESLNSTLVSITPTETARLIGRAPVVETAVIFVLVMARAMRLPPALTMAPSRNTPLSSTPTATASGKPRGTPTGILERSARVEESHAMVMVPVESSSTLVPASMVPPTSTLAEPTLTVMALMAAMGRKPLVCEEVAERSTDSLASRTASLQILTKASVETSKKERSIEMSLFTKVSASGILKEALSSASYETSEMLRPVMPRVGTPSDAADTLGLAGSVLPTVMFTFLE